MLLSPFVTSMLIARIPGDHISAPARLDLLETAKFVRVRKYSEIIK